MAIHVFLLAYYQISLSIRSYIKSWKRRCRSIYYIILVSYMHALSYAIHQAVLSLFNQIIDYTLLMNWMIIPKIFIKHTLVWAFSRWFYCTMSCSFHAGDFCNTLLYPSAPCEDSLMSGTNLVKSMVASSMFEDSQGIYGPSEAKVGPRSVFFYLGLNCWHDINGV